MQEILSNYSEEIINKAMKIKAVITDVDGVLTDGRITYDANGVETKSFNVKDGLIVKKLKECGYIGWADHRQIFFHSSEKKC